VRRQLLRSDGDLASRAAESGSSSTNRPAFVNCLHDFLGPPHRIRDCAHCVAGALFSPSNCVSFRAARILAAINSTRLPVGHELAKKSLLQ
jgi:hypothetical protein